MKNMCVLNNYFIRGEDDIIEKDKFRSYSAC